MVSTSKIDDDDGTMKNIFNKSDGYYIDDQTRALLAGIMAAPESEDPDAWMQLVEGKKSPAFKARLRAVRATIRQAGEDAIDAKRPSSGNRLAALRNELDSRGLAGFLVPRADEHQGEYVAPRSERLAWLTGFTGSAGLAVVLAGRAAVFVDGRYTLQAAAQVDKRLFEIRHLIDQPAEDWISKHLPKGAKLGYDPWLHTPDGVVRLKAAVAKAGGGLVAVDGNPIDKVWLGQPPPPISPIVAHDRRYAGRSAADKRREVAASLAGEGAEAAVLTAPDSIAWLLNVRGADIPCTPVALAFAILHGDGRVQLFVDSRKLAPGLRAHLGKAVSIAEPAAFGEALDGLGRRKARVLVDPGSAAAWIFDRLTQAGAVARRGADPCQLPKARKNGVEIEGTRAAHRRDGAALTRFLAWIARNAPRGRVDELQAVERLADFRRENELFRDFSFNSISGAGANGAVIHYRVTPETNRRLRRGELYLIDSGAQYLDGTTDVTRTVAIGTPTAEMCDRFTRVLKGHIALARARFPRGTTGSQLDALARGALWQAGLDYDHGTGHGVGLYLGVHEGPQRIAKAPSRVPLDPGMIVSNEPGYYKPGAYGIRIENLVLVVPVAVKGAERDMLGFETLTLAPIDRALIDRRLLDADEIAWLDAYHGQVRRTLTPLLDRETAAWLAAATRPLAGMTRSPRR